MLKSKTNCKKTTNTNQKIVKGSMTFYKLMQVESEVH